MEKQREGKGVPNHPSLRPRLIWLMNPRQYREYTKLETANQAHQSGFIVYHLVVMDHFQQTGLAEPVCLGVAKILPHTIKSGMIVIVRKRNLYQRV